jgi:hypothetical protein
MWARMACKPFGFNIYMAAWGCQFSAEVEYAPALRTLQDTQS